MCVRDTAVLTGGRRVSEGVLFHSNTASADNVFAVSSAASNAVTVCRLLSTTVLSVFVYAREPFVLVVA